MNTETPPAPRKHRKLKITLLVLAAVVLAFVIVVELQPAEYQVSRTTIVAASPAAAYAQVNDFHRWDQWNPWGKIDPAMKQGYEGAASGVGAVYTWSGNSQVGEGRMTMTECQPNELIRIKLEFYKPMAGTSIAEFRFQPQGNQTAVTWSMTGKSNFVAKAIHLFFNMDKMIGDQFERGLSDMKKAVES